MSAGPAEVLGILDLLLMRDATDAAQNIPWRTVALVAQGQQRAEQALPVAARVEWYLLTAAERAAQADLARCVFCGPFGVVDLDPSWLTWDGGVTVQLATAAYEECCLPEGTLDATRLAILSDALEEAGCSAEGILRHLRHDGPHVHGCWPLDLVLQKA